MRVNLVKLQYTWTNSNGEVTSSQEYGSEAFADSFMNYKYAFVPKNEISRADQKTYLKKVMVKNEKGEELHLSSQNKYYVYENTMVFPLGFRVSTTDGYKFVDENVAYPRDPRRNNQRELYRYLMKILLSIQIINLFMMYVELQ